MSRSKVILSSFALALVCATACGEGVQPDQRKMVYFTAVETDTLKPQPIPDPGVNLSDAQRASSEKIVDGFLETHERLLEDAEIERRVEQIENLFLATGRFHEIMVVYRDDFEKRGAKSHVADRFAWGLVRLGQRKQARNVINQLLVARPTEARIHFLDGAAYLQEQPPNPADFPAIVRAWTRVLDFDPNYTGYEGINAAILKNEIAKFSSAIPAGTPATAPPKPPTDVPEPPVEPVEPVAPETPPEVNIEPAIEAPPEVVKPTPQPVAEGPTKEQRYQLLVAKGEIALGQSRYSAAEEEFRKASILNPTGFGAEFGRLKTGWNNPNVRDRVAEGMRALAKRTDLTSQERIDLGVFLWGKLGRDDLAKEQWEAAKASDPTMAPRADALLKQLK